MDVDEFDFELPPELIAQRPVEPKEMARLLHVGTTVSDHLVRDLPHLLRPGDLLVFNDTKVIPARLRGRRGEGAVEVTIHKHVEDGVWAVFARPAKKLKPGNHIQFADELAAVVVEKRDGGEVILDFGRSRSDLITALEGQGQMPLPPYIKRDKAGDATDLDDYQTIFADRAGAVAAPTAGLHFSPELIAALGDAGIEHATLTLHVGAGTFLPVKVDRVEDHKMHAEWGEVTAAVAEKIRTTKTQGGRIIAVGTTVTRLLEAAFQETGGIDPFVGDTDIFITPGFTFNVIDGLITNFHLPRSTLFMLVSAFAGRARMRDAYAHAIASSYRFYSYGDCCLLERGAS